jgi:hypothetical protein
MTYNFDPERWLTMRIARLDDQLRRGELGEPAYHLARAELERRYEAMIERLDGTYHLPEPGGDGDGQR